MAQNVRTSTRFQEQFGSDLTIRNLVVTGTLTGDDGGDFALSAPVGTIDITAEGDITIYSTDNGNVTLQADAGSFNVVAQGVNIEDASGDDMALTSAGSIFIDSDANISLDPGTTGNINIGDAATVKIGFYGHATVAQQTGVAVTAGGIHAALVALGLITA